MLEENVVAAAGVYNRLDQQTMEFLIRDAGFTPKRRRTLYEPI
jgi:cyclic dehypoxanthinyl futalosine synthase